jgi:phospholipid/cholesterol/gamma-HCH transport system ATP-binding protein
MLFQGTALFDSMTVEENIMFPLNMFSTGQTHQEKKDRVNFCLERVNLEGTNDLYPAELSGGMKKRVGIARAIVHNPQYLFCDEPNSGLDPQTSIVIDHLIQEITEEFNTTTVINTHDMNSVMEIGDNVIFLHDNQKWWQGSSDEIIQSDNKELNDFMFASDFLKQMKDTRQQNN